MYFSIIADGASRILEAKEDTIAHYYNHHHDGSVTWNYGTKRNSEKLNKGRDKCQDNSPYCLRFVKVYGLHPPFTLCDQDWFTKAHGKYGCRKACALC